MNPQLLKTTLEVLKYCSVAVGTISGLLGTLTDTKDKETGRPTRWGRRMVILIVLSGGFSICVQSVETFLKARTDAEDKKSRDASAKQVGDVLTQAQAVKRQLDDQNRSLNAAVTGVGESAEKLGDLFSSQRLVLADTYGMMHPLGSLRIHMNVTYPLNDNDLSNSRWLARVKASTVKRWALINEPSDILNPSEAEDPREFNLLKQPEIDIVFNKTPTQPKRATNVVDHDDDILFRSAKIERTLNYVHFDGHGDRIEQQVYASMSRMIDNQKIHSLLDLYGAEVLIGLPRGAPAGSVVTECDLSFGGSSDAEFSKTVFLRLTKDGLRTVGSSYPSVKVIVLSEHDLGPRPEFLSHK